MDSQALVWTDRDGNKWPTRFDIPDSRRMKAAGYDLRNWPAMQRVFAKPDDFLDFAVEFFRPKFEEKSIEDVTFMVSLTGTDTSLAEAKDAIVRGIADFSRRCGDERFAAVLEKAMEVARDELERSLANIKGPAVDKAAEEMFEKIDAEFERALKEKVNDFGESLAKHSANAESVTEPG